MDDMFEGKERRVEVSEEEDPKTMFETKSEKWFPNPRR